MPSCSQRCVDKGSNHNGTLTGHRSISATEPCAVVILESRSVVAPWQITEGRVPHWPIDCGKPWENKRRTTRRKSELASRNERCSGRPEPCPFLSGSCDQHTSLGRTLRWTPTRTERQMSGGRTELHYSLAPARTIWASYWKVRGHQNTDTTGGCLYERIYRTGKTSLSLTCCPATIRLPSHLTGG